MNRRCVWILALALCLPAALVWADDASEPNDANAVSPLVAHLLFDGDVNDVLGNVTEGMLVGPEDPNDPNAQILPAFVDGIVGQALLLDGQSQYADLGASFGPAVIQPLASFTASVWVNGNNVQSAKLWPRAFQFGNADNSEYVALLAFSMGSPEEPAWGALGGPRFELKKVGHADGKSDNLTLNAPPIEPNEWVNLTVTLDAETTTAVIYVDGALAADANDFTRVPADVAVYNQNYVGMSADNNYFYGMIDDLQILNVALSAEEVAALVLAQTPVLAVEKVDAIEIEGTDIVSLDGIDANDLVLASITTDYEKYASHPATSGQDFSLATYASLDDSSEIIFMFPEAVTTVFLAERGGNDLGFFQALDAEGVPFGALTAFNKSDWLKPGNKVAGQNLGVLRIVADRPIFGVRVTPNPKMGLDPASVSGVPAVTE